MKIYIAGFTLLVCGLLSIPNHSQAYSVTDTSATDLGNGTALFTVTYQFGFLNRETYMPILANRSQKYSDKGSDAAYSILVNGDAKGNATSTMMTNGSSSATLNYTVLPGKAKALVLSDAAIKDGSYYLPKGKSGNFTLIAIVDLSKQTTTNDISLMMTSLPFTLIDGKKRTEARLSETELQPFKTTEIDLKK